MDKEIIIDGVNVAGCEYMLNNKIKGKQHCPAKAMPYAKETSCICRKSIDTPYNFCKHNPNCHYKQLKRLEQENAQKQEMIDRQWKLLEQCGVSAGGELKRVSYLLENLRKENAELKAENESLKEEIKNLLLPVTTRIRRWDAFIP